MRSSRPSPRRLPRWDRPLRRYLSLRRGPPHRRWRRIRPSYIKASSSYRPCRLRQPNSMGSSWRGSGKRNSAFRTCSQGFLSSTRRLRFKSRRCRSFLHRLEPPQRQPRWSRRRRPPDHRRRSPKSKDLWSKRLRWLPPHRLPRSPPKTLLRPSVRSPPRPPAIRPRCSSWRWSLRRTWALIRSSGWRFCLAWPIGFPVRPR